MIITNGNIACHLVRACIQYWTWPPWNLFLHWRHPFWAYQPKSCQWSYQPGLESPSASHCHTHYYTYGVRLQTSRNEIIWAWQLTLQQIFAYFTEAQGHNAFSQHAFKRLKRASIRKLKNPNSKSLKINSQDCTCWACTYFLLQCKSHQTNAITKKSQE